MPKNPTSISPFDTMRLSVELPMIAHQLLEQTCRRRGIPMEDLIVDGLVRSVLAGMVVDACPYCSSWLAN